MSIIDFLDSFNPLLIMILIVFILIIKGLIPFLPFPKELVLIYSGTKFGMILGTILNFVGLFTGAALSYILANAGRYRYDNRNQRLAKYQEKLDKYGWKALIFMRFSPISAQDVTSFASGFAKINKKLYYSITISAFAFYSLLFAYFGQYPVRDWLFG